jgi:SpoVK/Ycf46/Vps4 family AAA+-type ATPase
MEDHYMIDMKTYQSLHSKDKTRFDQMVYPGNNPPPKNEISKANMARNIPPGDDFKVLMPPKIKGYNFCRNEWRNLKVDQISDVVWQGEAFHRLEIDYEAKDLIRALVVNHLETENLADSTAGKGNGLTLLLHGGPGTGKKHTAESVAEIAKKPLYRVTCGDLGTKAEVVEQNLESALHLARLWACVVLLDEADIFLEQTRLGDLERNALASVFLRMLKSYNGIVILTTSRVGTFNEAIRSQIQLALHYPALNPYQRSMIWRNLIDQLVFSSDDLDISDLSEHAESLGNEDLNGRQIKNVLTNACRYARWKKVPLTCKHIKDVIEVSGRFGTFLEKGNEDELAFDEWLH